jgi:5-methylcytosine-specific restriction protein A
MEVLWSRHIDVVRGSARDKLNDSIELDEEEFPEGKVLYRLHRTYERDPSLPERAKALALKRDGIIACVICGFDFFETYGTIGKGFIECHHTIPVSELTKETQTKLSDVILVCSNCHRMLHRRRPWPTASDLKALVLK